MKIILFILSLVSAATAQQSMVNGKGGGITNPSAFMAALGAAPLSGATYTGVVSIMPSSTGGDTLLKLGNVANLPEYSGTLQGVLSIYSTTNFGIHTHSTSSNGLVASTSDGQAAKFIQKSQSSYTTDSPVVRVYRGNAQSGVTPTTSPMVVIDDTASAQSAGGAMVRVFKSGSMVFMLDNQGRPVLKATSGGSYFAIEVSSTGTLSTVNLGTSPAY